MIKNYALASVIILFFGWGCKKGATPVNSNKTYLLTMDIHDAGTGRDTTTYKYDTSNRLTEFYNTYAKTDRKFIYDTNDRLIEQDSYLAGVLGNSFTISYKGPSPTVHAVGYNANSTISGSSNATITLNSNGQAVKYDGGNNDYFLFTYDSNGNIVKDEHYSPVSPSGPVAVFTYTFGSKKNQLSGARGNFEILFVEPLAFVNDLISTTTVDNSFPPGLNYSTTNNYEYNTDNYPTKETVVSTNAPGVTNIHYYTYITF